jgi:ATP-dependent Lon protease
VKEKVLAARRAGISTVLLPTRNRRDLDEIPAPLREQLTFVWLDNVDQAVAAAIAGPSPHVEPPSHNREPEAASL